MRSRKEGSWTNNRVGRLVLPPPPPSLNSGPYHALTWTKFMMAVNKKNL